MSDSTVAEQEIREASAPPEALAEHTSSAEAAAQPQQRSLGRSLRAAEAGPAGLWRSLTATGMAGECLSLEDALSYVKAVKERVSPEEYAHFLRAVKEYQSGRCVGTGGGITIPNTACAQLDEPGGAEQDHSAVRGAPGPAAGLRSLPAARLRPGAVAVGGRARRVHSHGLRRVRAPGRAALWPRCEGCAGCLICLCKTHDDDVLRCYFLPSRTQARLAASQGYRHSCPM